MKLTMIIEVKTTEDFDDSVAPGGTVDPYNTDPHDVAQAIVDYYNESAVANGMHGAVVEFVSAEWSK